MRAMILAAGLGTRLRPLTDTIPKPLLPVAGVPLITWNLLLLRRAGITEVVINLHHLGHLIEKELGDGTVLGMQLSYSREPVILGTGGGIKQAAALLGPHPFVVLNGDTLLELDLTGLIRRHQAWAGAHPRYAATLLLRRDPDVERWGVVEVAGEDIVRINGRGRRTSTATQKRMFAGVHVIHPRVLDRLPSGPSSIIDAYADALADGEALGSLEFDGYWSDVGTPERYAEVQRDAERSVINVQRRLDRH